MGFEEERDSANDRAHDQQHNERPAERATDDRVIARREFFVFRIHLSLAVKQDLLEANRIIESCPGLQDEFKNRRKRRSRQGNEAEVFFAPKSAPNVGRYNSWTRPGSA